jgi:hypothetical protein
VQRIRRLKETTGSWLWLRPLLALALAAAVLMIRGSRSGPPSCRVAAGLPGADRLRGASH